MEKIVGEEIYKLIRRLYPICRSITGEGVRETFRIISEYIPLKVYEVPTGTKVFDWVVPKEWNIKDAYVTDENSNKIIDFKKNNLHIVGYSTPIKKKVTLSELQEHLHSLPDQPQAIPYITSYYKETWGFCLTHENRLKLQEGEYNVFIDSELKNGSLTYGEMIIKGKSDKEVFLSTYVCHPSLANDNLSGPAVATFIAKYLLSKSSRYSYRIIFIPETIGSITYLSKNLEILKQKIFAGFNLSCVGDERGYSYLPTIKGDTYADKLALNILRFKCPNFAKYSFLERGSDERQYNAPSIDLPVVSIMRTKYGSYPEYHTSLDNLQVVTPKGLGDFYELLIELLGIIENNARYRLIVFGEPQLGARGLYPTTSTKSTLDKVRSISDFIAYADGSRDLIDISNAINVPVWEMYSIIEKLKNSGLLKEEPLK